MGFALYFFVPLRLLLAKQSPSTHRPKTERKNQMDVFANHPVQQQTQNMILSQQQLQSLKMLELTAQELEKFLQEEFTENPALEWKSSWRTGTAPAAEPLSYEASCGLYTDEEQWKRHILDQLQRHPSFRAHAGDFLLLLDWADDDGLFRTPLAEFYQSTGMPADTAAHCLEVLRGLDPPGIFAADAAHCLLRQAQARGLLDDTLRSIILRYLSEIASGYYAKIADELHLPRKALARYIDLLKELSPHPLNGLVGGDAPYLMPDITLRKTDGSWEILLNDRTADTYCVSPYYAALYQQAQSPELHTYLKQSLDRARLIISALAQRRETLLRLIRAVIARQRPWLDGRGPLAPMTMSQLAAQLQVHPSTVSRAVKGKYIETPTHGTLALRGLFSQEVSAEGVSANAQDVRARIRGLIQREPADAPYSDQKLSALLEEQGIYISRRTVAKYRQEMCIPSAFARREGPSGPA